MCEEQPELAERGRCGDRPDRSFDAVDADAQLDLAPPQQIERVGGRAFPHDDGVGREVHVLAGADQARDVDFAQIAQVGDAPQELFLLGELIEVPAWRAHDASGSTRSIRQLPGTPLSS